MTAPHTQSAAGALAVRLARAETTAAEQAKRLNQQARQLGALKAQVRDAKARLAAAGLDSSNLGMGARG